MKISWDGGTFLLSVFFVLLRISYVFNLHIWNSDPVTGMTVTLFLISIERYLQRLDLLAGCISISVSSISLNYPPDFPIYKRTPFV